MVKKNKRIKVILFDWAGVFCLPGEPFADKQLQKALRLKPAEIEARVKKDQDKYYRGKISSIEFWNRVGKHFDLKDLSEKKLTSSYLKSYRIYPSMLSLAKKLGKKYRVGLISNLTNEMMKDIFSKHQIEKYFQKTIFSNQTGYLKPEPEIFNLALKKMRTYPEEVLFIDDSPKNVSAAKKMGMTTVLATTPQETKRKIEETLARFN